MSGHPAPEGWYRVPFGIHEDRWISDGRPTRLVRDAGVEASDEPPTDREPGELVPIPEPEISSRDDIRRADDAEAGPPLDEAAMRDRAAAMVNITSPP
jgi:hypothetical protein